MKKILKSKQGFTMIELIIVIAIIVILAAIAIPTFSGFVDNANQTATVSEARNVYMAAKVEIVEDQLDTVNADRDATAIADVAKANANAKGEVTGASISASEYNFTYTARGYEVTFTNGAYTVAP